MRKVVNLFFIILFIDLVISCTESIGNNSYADNSVKRIHLEFVQPAIDSTSDNMSNTRSAIYGTGTSFNFGFTEGDTIGIFPQDGYQIAFKLTVPEGQIAPSTDILAQGWMTKKNMLYACYMPFIFENRQSARIPWDLRKIQVERGNNGRDSMSQYAIFCSDTVKTTDTIFKTSVYFYGSAIVAKVPAPVTGTYTKAVLALADPAFATYGYFDLYNIKAAREPTNNITSCPYLHQPFHAEGYSNHVTLKLLDFTASSGETMYLWFIIPEMNQIGKYISVYVWDNKGNCYVTGKTLTLSFRRNRAISLSMPNATLTTTPYTNLNPWEEDKDTCSTCYPVAF
jgi:hypothetical protein